jgi:hypothetical protein
VSSGAVPRGLLREAVMQDELVGIIGVPLKPFGRV